MSVGDADSGSQRSARYDTGRLRDNRGPSPRECKGARKRRDYQLKSNAYASDQSLELLCPYDARCCRLLKSTLEETVHEIRIARQSAYRGKHARRNGILSPASSWAPWLTCAFCSSKLAYRLRRPRPHLGLAAGRLDVFSPVRMLWPAVTNSWLIIKFKEVSWKHWKEDGFGRGMHAVASC